MEQVRDTVTVVVAVVCMVIGAMIAVNMRSPLALLTAVAVTVVVMAVLLIGSELVIRRMSND